MVSRGTFDGQRRYSSADDGSVSVADGRTPGCARLGDVLVGRMDAATGCRAGLSGDADHALVLGSLGYGPVEHL